MSHCILKCFGECYATRQRLWTERSKPLQAWSERGSSSRFMVEAILRISVAAKKCNSSAWFRTVLPETEHILHLYQLRTAFVCMRGGSYINLTFVAQYNRHVICLYESYPSTNDRCRRNVFFALYSILLHDRVTATRWDASFFSSHFQLWISGRRLAAEDALSDRAGPPPPSINVQIMVQEKT